MSFILVTLMDAIGKRISAEADQQAEYDLRVVMAAFLRESRPAEVVLPVCLEIEGRDIVEQHTDNAAQYFPCVLHADILDYLMLTVAQFVKVAVYPGQVQVLIEVVLEILHRCSLAGRVGKTRLHQLAKDGILNPVETYTVKDMVEKQVCPV